MSVLIMDLTDRYDLRGKGLPPLHEFPNISALFSSRTKGEGKSLFFMYASRP